MAFLIFLDLATLFLRDKSSFHGGGGGLPTFPDGGSV